MSAAWLWLLLVAVAPGCRQILGIEEPVEQSRLDDAATDTSTPIDSAGTCYGAGFERVCLLQAPAVSLVISAATAIDTDTTCDPIVSSTVPACVKVGSTIDIMGSVRAVGSRPLVLVATGALHVMASIDVASYEPSSNGAGSGSAQCVAGVNSASNNGGGGGGSFGSSGGSGGKGPGGTGGGDPSVGPGLPTTFHGGCAGDRGSSISSGFGGAGGGAVYLISAANILIDGTINASGAGGGGGSMPSAGGGGGGSGGLIGFDAPTVTFGNASKLFANGGAGGGGASTGNNGMAGGQSSTPIGAAAGGFGGNANAGTGGNGGAFLMLVGGAGGNGQSTAAGGGGGGGVGVIKVFGSLTTNTGASLSPSPT